MNKHETHVVMTGVATALLVSAMAVRPAQAYFTDSHATEGSLRLDVAPRTDIEEAFDNKGKHVFVRNLSKSVPVWVRARAFATEEQLDHMGGSSADGAWHDGGDGWWYWSNAVEPGESTGSLDIRLAFKTREKTTLFYPDGSQEEFINKSHEGEDFNVVVVYEAVPVQSDDRGPEDASWA